MEDKKMKKTLLFAALAAAALAVSCQVKDVVIDTPENNDPAEIETPEFRTFVCEFATPDSKVAVTDAGKTSWEVGDEILINAGANGNERVTVTLTASDISADGKKATIEVPSSLAPYDRSSDRGIVSTYYAMYPAAAVAPGTLYYNQAFTNTNDKLMAACNVGDTFVFYNLNGIISFKVSGTFDKYVFYGNNDETVSYDVYPVRVRDDGDGPEVSYYKPADTYKNPTALTQVTGNLTADGTTVNYICLPGGANLTGGFTIKFYSGSTISHIATTNTAVNVEHGKILPLGDISSRLVEYVAPSYSDHTSAITGATDLSEADGPSNCYVISAPGAYKLPAVKGNKADKPAGTVFGVQLVWESYNNDQEVTLNSVIANVDFDGPTNYVFFETPATLKPGNALIAAKNSEDEIIWSWHIWIPETAFTTGTYGISSQTLMSRNLGALVDTKAEAANVDARSYGLIYQWGRKDPFLGSKRLNSSSQALIAGTGKSVSSSQFTIEQSIANPTTIVGYKGDWMTPENTTLWTESGDKSIYDPCPPGYRVPKRVSSDPLWSDVTALDASYGWEPNSTYGWWKLGTAVFPFAGYIDYDGGGVAHAYDRTRMWNAHKSTTEYAYDQQIWYENDMWKSKPDWQHRTACGNVVRCVVDWTIE